LAGSIRRKKPATDIDIVMIPRDVDAVKDYLRSHGKMVRAGDKISSSRIKGVNVDVLFADKQAYPATLMFATGGYGANIWHRKQAQQKGWLLNQYGLFDRRTRKPIPVKSEKDIYHKLGLSYRRPELRGLPRKTLKGG
jgi:DNA polymerase (family 10)